MRNIIQKLENKKIFLIFIEIKLKLWQHLRKKNNGYTQILKLI